MNAVRHGHRDPHRFDQQLRQPVGEAVRFGLQREHARPVIGLES
jgi:hypothetical protein